MKNLEKNIYKYKQHCCKCQKFREVERNRILTISEDEI